MSSQVGGSTGHASIALAQAFPKLRFTVQDLPETIADARTRLAESSISADIAERITFKEHDFFKPQPGSEASVYLLRAVLHNWSDEKCRVILGHLADALAQSPEREGRIIVMDTVMPSLGSVSQVLDARMCARDLTMLEVVDTADRSEKEWQSLFEQVGEGLVLESTIWPVGSLMSVLEVRPRRRKE